MTIASPSALAQTTFLACIARGGVGDNPEVFTDTIGVGDRAYRKAVDVFKFVKVQKDKKDKKDKKDSDQPVYYPDDNEEGTLFAARETAPGVFEGYDAIDGTQTLQGVPDGYQLTDPVGTRWQLVYFDENGDEIGWGFVANGGTPVSISCWTSFNGDPPH